MCYDCSLRNSNSVYILAERNESLYNENAKLRASLAALQKDNAYLSEVVAKLELKAKNYLVEVLTGKI